jgi:arginine exporter protein ArgO
MRIKTKILAIVILLSIVDMVIPFPIIGVILIGVLLQKPPWFEQLVREIYRLP